jgi:hypothetical protein
MLDGVVLMAQMVAAVAEVTCGLISKALVMVAVTTAVVLHPLVKVRMDRVELVIASVLVTTMVHKGVALVTPQTSHLQVKAMVIGFSLAQDILLVMQTLPLEVLYQTLRQETPFEGVFVLFGVWEVDKHSHQLM